MMIIINEKDYKTCFLLLCAELIFMFKMFFHHIKQLCKSFIALHESHLKLKQKISLRGSFGEKKRKTELTNLSLYNSISRGFATKKDKEYPNHQ